MKVVLVCLLFALVLSDRIKPHIGGVPRRYVNTLSNPDTGVHLSYDVTIHEKSVLLDDTDNVLSVSCPKEGIIEIHTKKAPSPAWTVGMILLSEKFGCPDSYVQHVITKEPELSKKNGHLVLSLPVRPAGPLDVFEHASIKASYDHKAAESAAQSGKFKQLGNSIGLGSAHISYSPPLSDKTQLSYSKPNGFSPLVFTNFNTTCIDEVNDAHPGCYVGIRPTKALFQLDVSWFKLTNFEFSVGTEALTQLRLRHQTPGPVTQKYSKSLTEKKCADGTCWSYNLKVGIVKISVTMGMPITLGADITSSGKLDVVTLAKAGIVSKAGITYTKANGWKTVFDKGEPTLVFNIANLASTTNFKVSPVLDAKLSIDITSFANAALSLHSYVNAGASVLANTCSASVEGGLDVDLAASLTISVIGYKKQWAKSLFSKKLNTITITCPKVARLLGTNYMTEAESKNWFVPVVAVASVMGALLLVGAVIIVIRRRSPVRMEPALLEQYSEDIQL